MFTSQDTVFSSGFQGICSDSSWTHMPKEVLIAIAKIWRTHRQKETLPLVWETTPAVGNSGQRSSLQKHWRKWGSFIACSRQRTLNVFGGKPQVRNWLNYWYSFYYDCVYNFCMCLAAVALLFFYLVYLTLCFSVISSMQESILYCQ